MIYLQDVPNDYAYCFAGKDNCPQAATCLRAIAAQLLSESKEPQPATINTMNALYVQQLPSPAACTLYRSSEPVRFAQGMTHLFDELPLKQAQLARRRVMGCFSCESYFYSSRNGRRLITLQEQQAIHNVFRSMGLNIAPKFDRFRYEVSW